MIQSCRHILAGNNQCAAPALRGKKFCRHHRDIHNWKRSCGHRSQIKAQSPTQTPTQTYDLGIIPVPDSRPEVYAPARIQPLELEFPEDRASIQINIYRITNLLIQGHIDRSTATALMYGMQVAQTNLGKTPLLESVPTPQTRTRSHSNSTDDDSETTYSDSSASATPIPRPVTRVILTPEGDEIAPPVEILEDNEADPIHHKGCPCLLCAEKYRNQPPEEHHPACQCGLCEEDEGARLREQGTKDERSGHREQGSEHSAAIKNSDVILSGVWREAPNEVEGPAVTEPATIEGAPSFAPRRVGSDDASATTLMPDPCALSPDLSPAPRKRIARATALLSGSTSRDPLNRPWFIAEYTFGDAIRRHEAQYAARAAAALAVGIEPPPYQPFITGLIRPGTPEWEEEQQMQQHSSEYWTEHFRKQIAERPDIQQYLDEEDERGTAACSEP